MTNHSELQIDLRQMILALETAVDLVGMNDTHHGKRVGYIASQLAHRLGFTEEQIHFAFELGLIHDCGVSTEQIHSNLVNHFDWEDVHIHCEIGYQLLKGFEPLALFAVPVLHHHTPWKELKNLKLDPHVARLANLIFLADRVDVMAAAHYDNDILLVKEDIISRIKGYSGTYFDPELVDAFLMMEKSEAFWFSLEDRHIFQFTWDMGSFETPSILSAAQLKQLSYIFGYIVDQKSPFTAQHSTRVGNLARYLAVTYGLSEQTGDKVEIAGFLHDIGKLRTPDSILEKPGALSIVERAIINQHSYETYEILRKIKGLEDIARWAAYHHEGVNGTGYPFHPSEQDFSIEARIISVADIFQALVQDRPYREGMPLDEVLIILNDLATGGSLEKEIVRLANEHGPRCYEIAKGAGQDSGQGQFPLFSVE